MRATIRTDHFITDAELERIGGDNPGWQVERIDGGVVMCPTWWLSGLVNARVTAALVAWGDRHGYAAIDSSTGVRMPNDDVLVPDGSLIARSRMAGLTAKQLRTWAPVPDLAVEVASSTDSRDDLRAKCRRYLMFGVTYVVLIDPEEGTFESWGDPLPGLDIDWAALSAGSESP